jgi:hypothetical protein
MIARGGKYGLLMEELRIYCLRKEYLLPTYSLVSIYHTYKVGHWKLSLNT